MFYLNSVGYAIMVSICVIPTLATSEPVTLGYFASVELEAIGAQNAGFECAINDFPAELEINEDTVGIISTNFPPAFLDRPITIRRGGELVPETADQTLTEATNDWHMTVSGRIGFCVGAATLQVMQGNLEVFAQLGQFEATVLSADDVLQDLQIKYETNAAGQPQAHFDHSQREGFPSQMNGRFVGSPPDEAIDVGRVLGRLDFDGSQLAIRFTDQNNLRDDTYLTRLNIRLSLRGSNAPLR